MPTETTNDTKFKPKAPPEMDLAEVERQLKLAQLADLQDQLQEKADRKEQEQRARNAGIESVKLQMKMTENKQSLCSHLKENGRTHLAGQKNHSNVYLLICQGCQKIWEGSDKVPPHLIPKGDDIVGGPH